MNTNPALTDWTIEFDDQGPDALDRRRFTLTWPIEPRLEGFAGKEVLITRRGQCFNSAQWRDFLAQGCTPLQGGAISPRSNIQS